MPAPALRLPPAVGALLLLLPAGAPVLADGMFVGPPQPKERVPVTAPGQKALVVRDGPAHEILVLQTTYRGPAEGFAWVVPVPGLPTGRDVFLADPKVLEELERSTRPVTQTRLRDPIDDPPGWNAVTSLSGGGGEDAGPVGGVIVHQRLPLGNYAVSIVSATDPGGLAEWLRRNGYALPAGAVPTLADYVRRRWHFVALRVRPQSRRGQTIAGDLQPIGIRFPTTDLVYPLAISRPSAGPITTLLLIVLDRCGVECPTLPTLTFPAEASAGPGSTYSRMARAILDRHSGRALLCEARTALGYGLENGFRGVRRDSPILPPRYGEPSGPGNGPGGPPILLPPPPTRPGEQVVWSMLVATRFWGELPPDAMRDLTFARTAANNFRLQVEREATMPAPRAAFYFASPTAYLCWTGLVFALALTALWPRPSLPIPEEGAKRVRILSRWLGVGLLACGVILCFETGLVPLVWDSVDGPSWLWALTGRRIDSSHDLEWLFFLWVLPGTVVARGLQRSLPRGAAGRAAPWAAMLLMLALGACRFWVGNPWRRQDPNALPGAFYWIAFIGLLILCWSLALMLGSGTGTAPRPGAVARALLGALLLALLSTATAVWFAQAGVSLVWPERHEAASGLDRAQDRLLTALRLFRDATGAYPRRLSELTATRTPATGLDPSGNDVPIRAQASLPLLRALPVDPVTQRRDTWVYEPRSLFLVESGAFHTTVRTRLVKYGPADHPPAGTGGP